MQKIDYYRCNYKIFLQILWTAPSVINNLDKSEYFSYSFDMKLLGKANEKIVIASVSHYDYREQDGLMADGGNPLCPTYSGYNRFSVEGETVWFEVPQNFADLYNDYQFNSTPSRAVRKYGIWKREDVRILPKEEWPDLEDETLKFENALWGTRGKDGKSPLKYVLL